MLLFMFFIICSQQIYSTNPLGTQLPQDQFRFSLFESACDWEEGCNHHEKFLGRSSKRIGEFIL